MPKVLADYTHSPPSTRRWWPIQLCFVNGFSDLESYQRSFASIDWQRHLGEKCPVCGKCCGYRLLQPYVRLAIELFPYNEMELEIVRFLCRKTGKTFSLLPHQLAPYHRYTISSIIGLSLLAYVLSGNQGLERIVFQLASESRVLPSLVRFWQRRVDRVLHRLSLIGLSHIAHRSPGHLGCEARDGPGCLRLLGAVIHCYAHYSGLFLLGTPSQQRCVS